MSVLAGIEAEAAGGAGLGTGLGNGLLPGSPQGKTQGWPATALGNAFDPSRPVSQSFRSNWQALFNTLASGAGVPDENEIATNASPEASQANQTIRTGESADISLASSSSAWQPAGRPPFHWGAALEKPSDSTIGSIAQPQAAGRIPTPNRHHSIGIQEAPFDRQTAKDQDVKSLSGASSSDSTGTRPAHVTKREKLESDAANQAPLTVLTSTFNGSITTPAPTSSHAATRSATKVQAHQTDLSSQSAADGTENPLMRLSPTASEASVNSPVTDAADSILANAGGRSDHQSSSAATTILASPDLVQRVTHGDSAIPAGATASIGADSHLQSLTASTTRPSPDQEMVQGSNVAGLSVQTGLEKPIRAQSRGIDAVSPLADQLDHGFEANSVSLSPTSPVASESEPQSPLPAPLGGWSSSDLLAGPPAVQVEAGPPVPAPAASGSRAARISAVSSAGKERQAPALSSAGSQPALAISATTNPAQAPDGPVPVSNAAQPRSLEPNAGPADVNAEQPGQIQPQVGVLPEESQTAALPARSQFQAEASKSTASTSKADIPRAEKPGSALAGSPGQVASRTAHSTEAHPTLESKPLALQPQIAGQSGDPSSLARDAGPLRFVENSSDSRTGNFSGSAPSEARETFAAIDNGMSPDATGWTHIGAHRAEAGIQDPALGWIGVRAEGSASQVHATLIPGSADAAQALSGHMAGLTAFLADAHTPVQSLQVALPENREAALITGSDQGQGMSQSSDQGMSQNSGQGNSSNSSHNFNSIAPASPVAVRSGSQVSPGSFSQAPGPTEFSGAHISVMA
jgi:hypothetical protein